MSSHRAMKFKIIADRLGSATTVELNDEDISAQLRGVRFEAYVDGYAELTLIGVAVEGEIQGHAITFDELTSEEE